MSRGKTKADENFYFVNDIMELTGFQQRKAYQIIEDLNAELAALGKITYSGRVSRKYFHLRHDIDIVEVKQGGKIVKVVV